MLQPILHLHKHRFGYDTWVAVFDKVAGQFAVVDPFLMGDVIDDICFLQSCCRFKREKNTTPKCDAYTNKKLDEISVFVKECLAIVSENVAKGVIKGALEASFTTSTCCPMS